MTWCTQWCWVLLLNSAHRLDLIGVCLGAVLVVASVLCLVSVPLKDVLISTVTGKLIAYPAAREKGKSHLLHRTQIRLWAGSCCISDTLFVTKKWRSTKDITLYNMSFKDNYIYIYIYSLRKKAQNMSQGRYPFKRYTFVPYLPLKGAYKYHEGV